MNNYSLHLVCNLLARVYGEWSVSLQTHMIYTGQHLISGYIYIYIWVLREQATFIIFGRLASVG